MTLYIRTLMKAFVSVAVIFCAGISYAQTNEANPTNEPTDDYSGGFLKLGVGLKSLQSPYHSEEDGFEVFFDGRYQWNNGLYIEFSNGANALNQRSNGSNQINQYFNFGYNLYNTQYWNFDANVTQVHSDINLGFIDGVDAGNSFEIHRKMTDMLGLRATGTFDNNTVQFIVAPHSFNDEYDDGLYASVWFSKQWQIKNWELYASVGAQYRSEEIIEYYYGVDGLENKPGFPDYNSAINEFEHYKADAGINLTTQIGVTYPINKDWLFEAYYKYTDLADSITDSPVMFLIVTSEGEFSKHISEASISINYVF